MKTSNILTVFLCLSLSLCVLADQDGAEKALRDYMGKHRQESIQKTKSHLESSVDTEFFSPRASERMRERYKKSIEKESARLNKLDIQTLAHPTPTEAVIVVRDEVDEDHPFLVKYSLLKKGGR